MAQVTKTASRVRWPAAEIVAVEKVMEKVMDTVAEKAAAVKARAVEAAKVVAVVDGAAQAVEVEPL
jgi:dihydroneopterin aldolase